MCLSESVMSPAFLWQVSVDANNPAGSRCYRSAECSHLGLEEFKLIRGNRCLPWGRVQEPSRELETDSRNYTGYFLRYKPLAAPYPFIDPFTAIRSIRDSWFVIRVAYEKRQVLRKDARESTRAWVQAYVLYYVHIHTLKRICAHTCIHVHIYMGGRKREDQGTVS